MAGSNGATLTVIGALAFPSTVITNCADVPTASPAGTNKLIWVSLLNRIVAARLLNVADTFVPPNSVPITVVSDPGTTGSGSKLAEFNTAVIAGAGGAVTVSVRGISTTPAISPAL